MVASNPLNWFAPGNISESEKVLRDLFVDEYLKDFDPVQACVRVGFQFSFAIEFSVKFMREPYVLRRIAELTRETPDNEERQAKEDRSLVLNVLRQAAQNGPFASRVQAASKLATILGMDKQENVDAGDALIQAFKQFSEHAPGG